jgi:hypothetical protein
MLKHMSNGGQQLYLPTLSNPLAVQIPDFNQLAPLMQEVGKAVFNIEQNDTACITESGTPWAGNNWTGAVARMADYRKLFQKLADILAKI